MSNKVTVKIAINGVNYPVSCVSGEEERLIKSSQEVNKVIDDLAKVTGGISETRLLVMTSLILADKLLDRQASDDTDLNLNQIEELIVWLAKATKRMNKVAMLLENK
tara:strand:+ start:353 stop:673 length:321 start_codon:yes stop_codon:yes gene_type:complete